MIFPDAGIYFKHGGWASDLLGMLLFAKHFNDEHNKCSFWKALKHQQPLQSEKNDEM